MSEGWLPCMEQKVRMMIEAIRANPGECILHLDADIQFFTCRVSKLLLRELDGLDLVAQSDSQNMTDYSLCGGFFALRANRANLNLFEAILEVMADRGLNDQQALNDVIRSKKHRAGLLPDDLFWSPRKLWTPTNPLSLPSRIVMHHANWCTGVENKAKQLHEGKRVHRDFNGMERHGSNYGANCSEPTPFEMKVLFTHSESERTLPLNAHFPDDMESKSMRLIPRQELSNSSNPKPQEWIIFDFILTRLLGATKKQSHSTSQATPNMSLVR